MGLPSRRRFVTQLAAAGMAIATPRWVGAAGLDARALSFAHLHTGERLNVEYFGGGAYRADALRSVDHLLRDFQMLRSRSEGVAAGSLHMVGRAVDIRLADVPLDRLRRSALSARLGGVGYYPASNFVHVDTGRVRAW